jgi:signal transduction histidine kinase
MTEEQQQRLFEPFFTTKEKGVGLGMSIVHRIIESHNGTIEIDSAPGQGTTFIITLPRTMPLE